MHWTSWNSSWEIHSSAPDSIASSNIFSSEISFLSILIIPNWLKLCDADPCVPKLPPFFWNMVLIFEAVLFLLSVKVSTITAI